MKYLVLALFVALASALPQGDRDREAVVVKETPLDIDVDTGAYKFGFETSNGIARDESGKIITIGEDQGTASQGKVSYTAPDGSVISLTFTADENGYAPVGSHLPTPPPVPEHVVQLLADLAKAAAKKA